MNEKTLELFLANYNNEGMCKDLPKFEKNFEKKFKNAEPKKIFYYPWAVVERFFRMQGGVIEIVDWAQKINFSSKDIVINDLTAEATEEEVQTQALFVVLKGTWQEDTLTEYYPIFDNQSSKVIKTPNAMQLNTARQRGMVRLIARLSGIGLKTFEQQDNQFEGDDTEIILTPKTKEEPKAVKKAQIQKETFDIVFGEETKAKAKEEKVTVKKQEEVESIFSDFLSGEIITPKKPAVVVVEEEEENFDNDTEEYAEKLLEVKRLLITEEKRRTAKRFLDKVGKETTTDFSYKELCELEGILKSE
jgi:hypothetical protein